MIGGSHVAEYPLFLTLLPKFESTPIFGSPIDSVIGFFLLKSPILLTLLLIILSSFFSGSTIVSLLEIFLLSLLLKLVFVPIFFQIITHQVHPLEDSFLHLDHCCLFYFENSFLHLDCLLFHFENFFHILECYHFY